MFSFHFFLRLLSLSSLLVVFSLSSETFSSFFPSCLVFILSFLSFCVSSIFSLCSYERNDTNFDSSQVPIWKIRADAGDDEAVTRLGEALAEVYSCVFPSGFEQELDPDPHARCHQALHYLHSAAMRGYAFHLLVDATVSFSSSFPSFSASPIVLLLLILLWMNLTEEFPVIV